MGLASPLTLHNSQSPQIRNRFLSSNPPGAYRDINIKLRVGFKNDRKNGRPQFCPVYSLQLHLVCFLLMRFLAANAGPKATSRRWCAATFLHVQCFCKLLIFCKVVEIQLHLKVRAPCPAVQRMRIVTLLLQELYDYVSANSDRIHKNYIRARNLMSQ